MFCPSCGFNYTQKTNYCKRCGWSLSVTNDTETPKMPRSRIVGMFWAIAMLCIVGLIAIFNSYDHLIGRGLRGDEALVPFIAGLMFIGAVAGLLIWQLSRMVTVHQKGERNVIVEKHYIREAPPAQLGSPTDPIQQNVERPSVVEHTTRQMAGKYREFDAPQ